MTLDELYDKIKDLRPLNLVPDVLDSGNIFDYFSGVMLDKKFVIDNPVVTPKRNDEEELIEIEVEGTSNSYGVANNLPVKLKFKTQLNELYIEATGGFQNLTLAVPGVSWFNINTISIDNNVYDADVLSRGVIKGKVSLLPNVTFAINYPMVDSTWVLNATLDTPLGLSDLVALCAGANLVQNLPPPVRTFLDLKVTNVGMSYNTKTSKLQYISLAVESKTPWQILPQLALNKIGLQGTIAMPGSASSKVSYSVTGHFQIGDPLTKNGLITVTANMPDLQITGRLDRGSDLYLKDLLGLFVPGVSTANFESRFTEFRFFADPNNSNYNLSGTLLAGWTIDLKFMQVTLKEISANLQYMNSNTTGGLSGVFELLPAATEDEDPIVMEVSAEHPKAGDGWIFSGRLADGSSIDLKKILERFLGIGILPASGKITVKSLDATFETKTGDYSFAISIDWGELFGKDIPLTISDTTLNISSKSSVRTGYISGTADFKGVALKLRYDFSNNPEQADFVTFTIFDIEFKINTTKPDYILTIKPKGKTVGDLVTFLVNAAARRSGISLPAPWDVLNTISLDSFEFSVNFTKKKIGFKYDISTNLGFVNIKSISLYYSFNSAGADKKVEIGLEGSFLGQAMPPPWDVLKSDSAPKVPGKGNGKFDLKFLGVGQLVGVNMPSPTSVKMAVDNLSAVFKNPPKPGSGLVFDPSVNWLIGTRFVLLNMISIDGVFYDPLLYGLGISVTDGKFKNLKFEVLYKKVSDNIGVYQILLQLPSFIRQMEFGALSITLPNIGVWIYTNGDFKIDFGFPQNGDFSGSFGVQFLPFVGAGGFYFGMLSTETAPQLPRDYNRNCGSFDPVIVFGVGLRIGLGKSIDKGILKAELSLTLQGIIEGTIAFFNAYPAAMNMLSAANDNRPVYYYIQGQISIVGKVYGEINFAIISASLELTVTLSARAVIEAYQAMLINFTASVSVSLKVSINLGLFSISIRLSFNTSITQSFTLGSYDPGAPWNCGRQLTQRRPKLLSLTSENTCPIIPDMKWQPIYLCADCTLKPVELYFAPQFTVTTDIIPSVAAEKNPRGVAMMYIRSQGLMPGEPSPFSVLSRGILTWVFNAYYNKDLPRPVEQDVLDKTVTVAELQEMYCYLSQDRFSAETEPFTYEQIIAFLSNHFEFSVILPPEVSTSDTETSIFPLFPLLTMETPAGKVDFDRDASIQFTPEQLVEIKNYFRQLSGRTERSNINPDPIVEKESLARYVFIDFFTMIAKEAVQAAMDKLKSLQSEVKPGETLEGLAAKYKNSGITIEELAFANRMRKVHRGARLAVSGAKYTVRQGDTSQTIAKRFRLAPALLENSGASLSHGQTLILPDLLHHANEGESLRSIAGQYRISVEELAVQNRAIENIFVPGKRIVYPNVESMNAGELLDIMQEQFVFDHLAGLSARVLLQGLRPPSPPDSIYAGEPAAFYALSLQQFDASALEEGTNISIGITGGVALDWLKIDGGTSLTMPVTADVLTLLSGLESAAFQPEITGPSVLQLAALRPRNFTLATQIEWRKTESSLNVSDPSIWPLSSELVALLQSGRKPLPTLSLFTQVQEHDNAVSKPEPVPDPTWSMRLDIQLRRVPGGDKTMYELSGTGQSGASLLEQLLRFYAASPSDVIKDVNLLYAPAPAEAGQQGPPSGLQSDPIANTKLFIVQSNLSSVSHPPATAFLLGDAASDSNLVGQTGIEFLKLLWECSITGTGGFFLYYAADTSGRSLPDYLFNATPDASVTLLVTLNLTAGVPGFVNSVVLNQTIDPSHEVLFAQASFPAVTHTMEPGETLHDLTRRFYTNLSTIARENAGVSLNTKQALRVPARRYRLKKGENLSDISKHHGLLAAEVSTANEQAGSWKPQVGEWMLIPSGQHEIAQDTTLAAFAAHYHVSEVEVLHANRHVANLFAGPLQFDNTIEEKISLAPAGSVGFTMSRKNPSLVSDPYQRQLLELYNLLEYRIAPQGIFNGSNPAIPSGPVDNTGYDPNDTEASLAPPPLTGEDWQYENIFPVFAFVKDVDPPQPGLPDPAQNPYRPIFGSAKQQVEIEFNWNDIFGNSLAVDVSNEASTWPKLPIPVGYTDQLIALTQWRNVLPGYVVRLVNGTPKLEVNFRFLSDRYTDIEDPEARRKNAATDQEQYKLLYYQLGQEDVTVSFSTTMDHAQALMKMKQTPKELLGVYVGQVYAFLDEVAKGNETPPLPDDISIAWPIADQNPANIFLLNVNMTIQRELDLVTDEFKDQLSCSTVTSVIKPDLVKSSALLQDEIDQPLTLKDFAINFELAFPELKVLTGPPAVADGEATDQIWLARFSEATNGIWLSILSAGNPFYYAVKPLSVNLITNNVPVFRYTSGNFIGTSPTMDKLFSSVDMETHAAAFLAAVDLFLSSQYVINAWMTQNSTEPVPGIDHCSDEPPYEIIIQAKRDIAAAISTHLFPVFDAPWPDDPHQRHARESLRQELLVQLSNA
ncbi:MAG TPA: LysM peptidoglycan-binding domain-containing protein, partial [Bacteroidia bacterium]|nr:LysM peptidoglycan-binding domain-containing protein [Bacteroidia bacterium]